MSYEALSLILDLVVICVLGFTIYYALKLSKSLNSFSRYRKDFGRVVEELSAHINRAEKAIQNLKEETMYSGHSLQDTVNQSKEMAEELRLMTEVGENLAKRLENIAEKSGLLIRQTQEVTGAREGLMDDAYGDPVEDDYIDDEVTFLIQDREFEHEEKEASGMGESEAERDLYNALKRNKKVSGV